MDLKIRILTTIILFLLAGYVYGQGCSDAGVCTISSFKPQENVDSSQIISQIKIGASYGQADRDIAILSNYVEYNWNYKNHIGWDFKLTSLAQSGNGISTFGVSDLFINTNYNIRSIISLIVGVKIPLNKANKAFNGLPLPMDYQSSLGTFDAIIGFNFKIQRLQLVTALQYPLSQNKNEFIAENYPNNSKLKDFTSTNKFKRSGDVLLRISYPLLLGSKFKLTPSLLPIYHLVNDKYTDGAGIQRAISSSNGLTLNANVYFDYNITSKSALQLNFGAPLIVREVRPDGLTRSFIGTLEYRFRF